VPSMFSRKTNINGILRAYERSQRRGGGRACEKKYFSRITSLTHRLGGEYDGGEELFSRTFAHRGKKKSGQEKSTGMHTRPISEEKSANAVTGETKSRMGKKNGDDVGEPVRSLAAAGVTALSLQSGSERKKAGQREDWCEERKGVFGSVSPGGRTGETDKGKKISRSSFAKLKNEDPTVIMGYKEVSNYKRRYNVGLGEAVVILATRITGRR